MLDNNDSTIDCILSGDCIKIVEDLKIDSSYYNSLFEKYKNKNTYEIRFEDSNTNLLLKYMSFPNGISEKEMIKAFLYNMKIPYEKRNYFAFYNYEGKILGNYNYEGKFVGDNDTQIQFPLKNNKFFFYKNFIYPEGFYGKILKVSFEDNIGLSIFLNNRDIYAGSLQKIKDFFIKIKDYISKCNVIFIYKILENPIIYPGEIELKIDDEKTFSSVGIIEDFICKLKVKIKDGSD